MQIVFVGDQVSKFIDSLEKETRVKIHRLFGLLEKYGRAVGMPQVRRLGAELCELRVSGRQNVRLFFAFREPVVVILHGFVKKSMRIPWKELETARNRLEVFTEYNP